MARARLKADTTSSNFEAVGRIIIAAWFKALPDTVGDPIADLADYKGELSAALTNILSVTCEAMIDEPDKIYVTIPRFPENIKSKQMLVQYLHKRYDESTKANDPDNPFNPKNNKKHGSGASPNKRTFAGDFGDAVLFGCGR